MDNFVSITPASIIDVQKLRRKFGTLGVRLMDVGTEAGGKYLLKKFKDNIPPQKHVSRKQAYGKTFFSDKQRRWFFANRIWEQTYKRTNAVRDGWKMEGSGHNLILRNDAPGVQFVYGEGQAKQLALVGWRKASSMIDDYQAGVTDAAARAITKEIKAQGL